MNNKTLILWLAPFAVVLLLFMTIPAAIMVKQSFSSGPDGGFTLVNYAKILTSKFYLKSFKNTLTLALISSIVGLGAGSFSAYALNNLKNSAKYLSIINLTSNFAGIPLAFSFIVILGNSGITALLMRHFGLKQTFDLYSWNGLMLVYIYFQIPLAILLMMPVFNAINKNLIESSKILGAREYRFWFKVGLPIIMPGLLGSFGILVASAMGAFVTAYALVSSNFNLLPIRIVTLTAGDVVSKPELACALGVLMGLLIFLIMMFNSYIIRLIQKPKATVRSI